MKVTIEIFDWSEQKPKAGSSIVTWGYFDGPAIPDTIDLDCSEGPSTVDRVWVNDDDEEDTLEYAQGQDPESFEDYTLYYKVGGDITMDDESFLWAYYEDFEDIEVTV